MKLVKKFVSWLFKFKFIRTLNKKVVLLTDYLQFKLIFPRLYKKCAKNPIDPKKIVFVEGKLECLTNSLELMYDYMLKEQMNVSCHFINGNNIGRVARFKRMYAMIKDIATAKSIFINDTFDVMGCYDLRDESKLIQLWHACGAFKKWGFSTADKIFGLNEKELRRFPPHRNYSLATVSSPEVIWAYEEAFDIKESGIVKALGTSRTDVFFDEEFIARANQVVYNVVPQAKNKKIILYAPTFRGRVKKAAAPRKLDFQAMFEALSDEYIILIKHHPFVKKRPKILEEHKDFAIDVTNDLTIEELLICSDICISDYSSLVFEYSLFERPMLFYAYDLEKYFDWRGFYYDYKDFVPGPIVSETTEIIDYILNIEEHFDKEKVIAFREKFMSACDGKATQRIAEYALN